MTARDRLGVIEARANAATDGPWDVGPPGVVFSTGTDAMVQTVATGIGPGQMQDAVFIAHARTDVPAMVWALQAVLYVCEVREPSQVEGSHDEWQNGFSEGARTTIRSIRAAIEAALQEEP